MLRTDDVVALPEEDPELLEEAYQAEERFEEIYGHPLDASDEDIVELVNERFDEQDSAAWERFHRWAYQIRFVDGDQWLITTDGRTYFNPPAPDGTVRVVNNLSRKAAEYRIAKLTETRPIGKILPHSNEVDDADRAEAGQQLVRHLEKALNITELYDEALWWDTICGCGFMYVGWELETGEFVKAKKARMKLDEMGIPQVEFYFCDAEGNEVDPEGAFEYRLGEVDVRVIPPWAIRVSDPLETDPDRQRYWIWSQLMEVSEIKRRFGALANEISGGAEHTQYAYYENLVVGGSPLHFRRPAREKEFEPKALVKSYFEKKSAEYPHGRYIVVCDDVLLHYGTLPYGDIPFVQIRTNHRPHDFYGKAVVEDWIPVQKRINQLESHAIEYIRLFAKGGLAAEYGTLIEESWNDSYGSVLYYSGERPQPMAWGSLPSDVWQSLNRAYENFDRIAGWADVARGDVPGQVKAARAITELKRSNDTPLGKALQKFDIAVERLTRKLIERAQWGYAEERWIQVLGADVPHMVKSISAESLPVEFSVEIESDSMMRLSYPAKLELLFELADRQWISQQSAMRLLNFGDWEHQSGQWNRDYGRARWKMERLLQGEPVGVDWWETDAIHMLAIEERLKDPRYDTLEDWQKQALTQLWTMHLQQDMMKQQGAMPPMMEQGMPMLAGAQQQGALPPGGGQAAAPEEPGGQPQPVPNTQPPAEPNLDRLQEAAAF